MENLGRDLGKIVADQHLLDPARLDAAKKADQDFADGGARVYVRSLRTLDKVLYGIVSNEAERMLFAASEQEIDPNLAGDRASFSGLNVVTAPLSWESYLYVRERFPFVTPVSLRQKRTTIGCGDRLGLATPGHIRALRGGNASGVFAQQSIRELNLTGRNYRGVVSDAAFGVFQEGFEAGYGADGDHLKTLADIDVALDAGMPMITLDLTEVMDPAPAGWSEARVDEAFADLPEDVKRHVREQYEGREFEVGEHTIAISATEARRCALMYWKALDFSRTVDRHLARKRPGAYDLEISIDETTAPTLPSHHLFITSELAKREVSVNSLAPRFVGEFQKGIDYIGDVNEFERQFVVHCAIARAYGDYKISIHSGSDKFSVYPAIGRHTKGRLHLKTAGTSWLEAVRTIARYDADLYRLMHATAFDRYDEATKLYHITADLSTIAPLSDTADEALPGYLDRKDSRQLIHITYGGLLGTEEIRRRFFQALWEHERQHYDAVESHIRRHVELLGVAGSHS